MGSLLSWGSLTRILKNGRNNPQLCCPNNVGSCCVRVGSGVQTDLTTPINVETCSASWEGYKTHKTLETNRVYKRTQYVISNNAGSCWLTMLRPFAQGLTFISWCARRSLISLWASYLGALPPPYPRKYLSVGCFLPLFGSFECAAKNQYRNL